METKLECQISISDWITIIENEISINESVISAITLKLLSINIVISIINSIMFIMYNSLDQFNIVCLSIILIVAAMGSLFHITSGIVIHYNGINKRQESFIELRNKIINRKFESLKDIKKEYKSCCRK